MAERSLRQFPQQQIAGGGSGGGLGERLRQVELDVRELKTDMKHVATKAWILGGLLGGMGVAAGIATAIAIAMVRLLSSD